MRSRRQWSEAFRSLNGIEISSPLRPTETIAGRAAREQVDDVLFPWLRSYPYTTIYITYTEGQERGERKRASDKALTDIVQEPAGSAGF